jgi:hypothetical protein
MKLSIRLRNALVFAFLMVSTLMPGKMGIAQGLTYVKTLASPSPKAIGEETLIHSNGNIYVGTFDAMYIYSRSGEYLSTVGSYGSGQLQWRDVHGICELTNALSLSPNGTTEDYKKSLQMVPLSERSVSVGFKMLSDCLETDLQLVVHSIAPSRCFHQRETFYIHFRQVLNRLG